MTYYPSTYDVNGYVQQFTFAAREIATAITGVAGSIALVATEMRRANDLKEEIYRAKQNEDPLAFGPL